MTCIQKSNATPLLFNSQRVHETTDSQRKNTDNENTTAVDVNSSSTRENSQSQVPSPLRLGQLKFVFLYGVCNFLPIADKVTLAFNISNSLRKQMLNTGQEKEFGVLPLVIANEMELLGCTEDRYTFAHSLPVDLSLRNPELRQIIFKTIGSIPFLKCQDHQKISTLCACFFGKAGPEYAQELYNFFSKV